jgi:hypothetical protein
VALCRRRSVRTSRQVSALEHNGRRLAVPAGAEPNERGLLGDAHVRAVLVGVEHERRAELRGERGERASRLGALLERARVVAEEDVDFAAGGEALERHPLARCSTVPVATGSPWSDGKRAAIGEAAQAAEPEARSGRQVVQAGSERHRAEGGGAGSGTCERPGVVVVSVHEEELEAGPVQQYTNGAEEPAPIRVAGQVAEVAQGHERVAALFDGSLNQSAQVASVAMQVAKSE